MSHSPHRFWVVEYADPETCTGESVAAFCQTVESDGPLHVVICGVNDGPTRKFESVVELIDFLRLAPQIDWGDVHFVAPGEPLDPGATLECRIESSFVTVRVADNSFLFVYTRVTNIKDAFRRKYPTAIVTSEALNQIKFMW